MKIGLNTSFIDLRSGIGTYVINLVRNLQLIQDNNDEYHFFLSKNSYDPEYFDEARQTMAAWIKAGQLTYREHIVEGLENAPEAFCGMFRGENFGRGLVHIADPSTPAKA